MSGPAHRSTRLTAAMLVAAALVLAGCAGGGAPTAATRSEVERAQRAGLRAFAQGRFSLAEAAFRDALRFAYERDDAAGALDARYNLAASLAEQDRNEEALGLLQDTIDDQRRAGTAIAPDLLLLEATLQHRQGDTTRAAETAARLRAGGALPPALEARAWFVSGLAAASERRRSELQAAIEGLVDGSVERDELTGYLAALDGDPQAPARLSAAARRHGERGDARGVSRALAGAAASAESAGAMGAAALHYLRAGRSAAAQGRADRARRWLTRAETLAGTAGDGATARQAREALAELAD